MARETLERKVVLDKDNVDWFTEQYPRASLSGILDMLLENFRKVSEFTPAHYADVAAKMLAEKVNGRESGS